jgi:glucosamine 6-phosphate synthetase-like amidotransferase/phosphosugar isomerase protein
MSSDHPPPPPGSGDLTIYRISEMERKMNNVLDKIQSLEEFRGQLKIMLAFILGLSGANLAVALAGVLKIWPH